MNREEFYNRMLYYPQQDDLERVNCPEAGDQGHRWCGWCNKHNRPKYHCASKCLPKIKEES